MRDGDAGGEEHVVDDRPVAQVDKVPRRHHAARGLGRDLVADVSVAVDRLGNN